MGSVEVEVRTRVAAPPEVVWEHASTMAGVNSELRPLRMSHPADRTHIDGDVPLGEPLFTSTLTLGPLPIDRHEVTLVGVDAPHGFDEDSRSWLHRRWRHERRLVPVEGGCEIVDRLRIDPRLPGAGAVTRALVGRVFARRHRVLAARFGRR
ncbi:hypothetical protein FTX61_00760 [Nitriliruptoraceae bacterium ZYF776]|nr:hypothetical protein [Profundirhabdus halotolerans]